MAWKKKKKVSQEISSHEILELHRKTIRKSVSSGHRVYFRYDKDNPRKSNMLDSENTIKKVIKDILISIKFCLCLTMPRLSLGVS